MELQASELHHSGKVVYEKHDPTPFSVDISYDVADSRKIRIISPRPLLSRHC
jgi:hypothetical protein